MSPRFPLVLAGSTYASADDLVADVERRGRMGLTDHPGQISPAQHFDRADEEGRDALDRAATLLVRETADPGVFLIALHLGRGVPFFHALFDRLDQGPPLPEGTGLSGATLHDDVIHAFHAGPALADAGVRRRLRDYLARIGRAELIPRLGLA